MRTPTALLIVTGIYLSLSGHISAQSAQPVAASFNNEKVADGLSSPQGLAWNNTNTLFISNANSNWISRITDNKIDTFAISPTTPTDFKKLSGIALYEDGSLYACDYERGAILKFSDKNGCEVVSPGFEGEKYNRPNDLVFDEDGNLYFTDPKSNDQNTRDGRIFLIPKGSSRSKLVFDGLVSPGGLAISPNGDKLYVCESALNRVIVFQIKKDKTLNSYYEFVELPGGNPTSIAIDSEGNLLVAHSGTGTIYIISHTREIMGEIKTPCKLINHIVFGDNDMKSLFITEGEKNSVYKIRVDIPGLKLFSSP